MRTPPRLARLRRGEWVVGGASVALLVGLLDSTWFRVTVAGAESVAWIDRSGWQSLAILGPLALVVGILGVAVWWLQATCRAPALPVCATVLTMLLSFVLVIGLLIRVLLHHPDPGANAVRLLATLAHGHVVVDARFGAYAGLLMAVLVLAGCYRSLREDGIAPGDAPLEIEIVQLAGTGAAGAV